MYYCTNFGKAPNDRWILGHYFLCLLGGSQVYSSAMSFIYSGHTASDLYRWMNPQKSKPLEVHMKSGPCKPHGHSSTVKERSDSTYTSHIHRGYSFFLSNWTRLVLCLPLWFIPNMLLSHPHSIGGFVISFLFTQSGIETFALHSFYR